MIHSPKLEEYSKDELHQHQEGQRIGFQRPFELGEILYGYYTNRERGYARGLINLKWQKVKSKDPKNCFWYELD
jgi:hypothetical protein